MVEVGVPDEDAGGVVIGGQEAIERHRVRDRRAAQQQAAQRHAGEVGVDVEAAPLERDPVAGDAQPLELEPGRKLERPRLELGQGLEVVGGAHSGQLMPCKQGFLGSWN
ncbi:MAG: hypothetical protein ACHQJ5_01410 [Vicinamibacteria bacterium]